MVKHPELIVGAIIQHSTGDVLLIRQKKWDDQYSCFIGGHVRYGEPLLQALQREIHEEVGLTVSGEDASWWGWREVVLPARYHRDAHLVFLNYLINASERHLKLGTEVQEALWVPVAQGIEMVMPENRADLERLLALQNQ